jgi:hypothetical protein
MKCPIFRESHTQCVPRVKRLGHEAEHSAHLMPMLRRLLLYFPYLPVWCAEEQLYL